MYVRPSVPVFLLAAVHPELGGALLLAPGAQRGEQQEPADSRGRVTTIGHICNQEMIDIDEVETWDILFRSMVSIDIDIDRPSRSIAIALISYISAITLSLDPVRSWRPPHPRHHLGQEGGAHNEEEVELGDTFNCLLCRIEYHPTTLLLDARYQIDIILLFTFMVTRCN